MVTLRLLRVSLSIFPASLAVVPAVLAKTNTDAKVGVVSPDAELKLKEKLKDTDAGNLEQVNHESIANAALKSNATDNADQI